MSVHSYTIAGSEYSRTSSGEEITVTYVVNELGGAAAGRMYTAAIANGLPRWGARHPSRPDLIATDFRSVPLKGQPYTAMVTVRYQSAGLIDSSEQLGAVTVSMSTEVVSEETTKDINGDDMRTSYISRSSVGITGSSIDTTTQIHRVSVERPTFAVQFTRIENSNGFATATEFAGKTNSVPWQGKPAKHWLLRVSSSPTQEKDRFNVRYDAVYNPKSWVAVITHVENGVTPQGVIFGVNGISEYDVYDGIDYNRLGLPRRL